MTGLIILTIFIFIQYAIVISILSNYDDRIKTLEKEIKLLNK